MRNTCPESFEDVTFSIQIEEPKTGEQLDTSEIVLKGTTLGLATRGFVQNVQLRIESRNWTWYMTPLRARHAVRDLLPTP